MEKTCFGVSLNSFFLLAHFSASSPSRRDSTSADNDRPTKVIIPCECGSTHLHYTQLRNAQKVIGFPSRSHFFDFFHLVSRCKFCPVHIDNHFFICPKRAKKKANKKIGSLTVFRLFFALPAPSNPSRHSNLLIHRRLLIK